MLRVFPGESGACVRVRLAALILTIAGAVMRTSPHISDARLVLGTSGTLVVTVPAKGGLLIAGDTRSTTMGVACDGNSKISVVNIRWPTVVAATATATWISARYPLWPDDPCGDLAKNGIVLLDVKKLTQEYLEGRKAPVWNVDLQELSNYMIAAVLEVHKAEPAFVHAFAGRTMFQIVLAGYQVDAQLSHVRALQFNLTPALKIEVKQSSNYKFKQDDAPDWPHFGDTETFHTHVMVGVGKQFLPASFSALQGRRRIEDVSKEEAQDVGVHLIEAAKQASALVSALNSIGGAVEAYFLSAAGAERVQ